MPDNIPGENEGDKKEISRREFLKLAGSAFGASVLLATGADKVLANTIEKSKRDRYLKGIAPRGVEIPKDSLGAIDENNPKITYQRAIKEGGVINSGELKFKITYGEVLFKTMTYLHSPKETGLPSVGDVLPYIYFYKPESANESVLLNNFAISTKETKSIEIGLDSPTTYAVMPIVTTGNSSDIVDIGNTSSKGFEINPDNITGATRGFLSFAFLQLASRTNPDNTYGLQVLGVVDNSKQGGGVFLDGNLPDKEIVEKYNIGK